MTAQQAIETIKYASAFNRDNSPLTIALNMAIEALEKQAEYKSLEEQGLLLRLPIAIGSDVFFIPSKANFTLNILHYRQGFNRVYHQKNARLHFTENGWYAEGNLNLEYGVTDAIFVDKLYKETWFTTKEEAEAALEKMKEGENGLD